ASLTLGGDLFPRDFIYSLPRPSRYIGAERIFGRAALDREGEPVDGLDVIRIVPDEEVALLVPRGRHLDDWVPEVTPSLNAAILDWVLATAAKEERLGPGISSMLIHTTMRVAIQDALAEAIGERLVELRREWRYETAGLRAQLYYRWNRQFRPTTASLDLALDRTFEQIEPQVNAVLLGLDDETLLVLNNRSKQQLNYEDDSAQKIVLIGGNRLSRGLTIEYLTVSFFVRESNNYDTLLQMGRWFGYRSDYVDLTRLWTTRELVSRFEHLALVEEELRDDIAIYQRERLTPLEVAPKIRSHPVMTVTADNKMGSGRTFQQSYSGQRIQTTRFRLGDDSWLGDNVDSSRQLLGALGQPTGSARGQTDRPCWVDIPWTYVVGFLENFRSLQRAQSFDSATASQYVRTQAEMHGELISWTVSVRSGAEPDAELGSWDLGITGWGGVAAISRSRKKADPESIGVLTNPPRQDNLAAGDEAADLTDAQLIRAARQLSDYPTPGHAIRAQRDKTSGLILLYPISPFSTPKKNSQDRLPLFDEPEGRPLVVGVALSFPYSSSPATVEYVVGRPSHAYADDDE
ncbi:MAG: Z1 domain-containing protein, partial [Candidatus Nanopelagicales bacterium]|nr:Z1 domain-containing protein [Candidatus Nanopelagicales bacterium]